VASCGHPCDSTALVIFTFFSFFLVSVCLSYVLFHCSLYVIHTCHLICYICNNRPAKMGVGLSGSLPLHLCFTCRLMYNLFGNKLCVGFLSPSIISHSSSTNFLSYCCTKRIIIMYATDMSSCLFTNVSNVCRMTSYWWYYQLTFSLLQCLAPCATNNGNCSQFCWTTSSITRDCDCALGFFLAADGTQCISRKQRSV